MLTLKKLTPVCSYPDAYFYQNSSQNFHTPYLVQRLKWQLKNNSNTFFLNVTLCPDFKQCPAAKWSFQCETSYHAVLSWRLQSYITRGQYWTFIPELMCLKGLDTFCRSSFWPWDKIPTHCEWRILKYNLPVQVSASFVDGKKSENHGTMISGALYR